MASHSEITLWCCQSCGVVMARSAADKLEGFAVRKRFLCPSMPCGNNERWFGAVALRTTDHTLLTEFVTRVEEVATPHKEFVGQGPRTYYVVSEPFVTQHLIGARDNYTLCSKLRGEKWALARGIYTALNLQNDKTICRECWDVVRLTDRTLMGHRA